MWTLKRFITAGSLAVLLVAAGCGSAGPELAEVEEEGLEEAVRPSPASSVPEPASAVGTQMSMTGELTAVDVNAEMVTLSAADGAEQTFLYTESTVVTGVSGVQGLAAEEGSRAIVHYDPGTDPPTALSIEVNPF